MDKAGARPDTHAPGPAATIIASARQRQRNGNGRLRMVLADRRYAVRLKGLPADPSASSSLTGPAMGPVIRDILDGSAAAFAEHGC